MKENAVEMRYLYELAYSVLGVRAPAPPPSKLNWETVCREAARLSMSSFLYYGIKRLNENDQPSISIMTEIKKWKIEAVQKEWAQHRLLTKVFHSFDIQHIKSLLCNDLPLKHLYPYPDLRYRENIKLFLSDESYLTACKTLRNLGGSRAAMESQNSSYYLFDQTTLIIKKRFHEKPFPFVGENLQKYKHYSNIYEQPPETLYRQLTNKAAQASCSQKDYIWSCFDLSMLQRFYHFSLPAKNAACQVTLKSFTEKQMPFQRNAQC